MQDLRGPERKTLEQRARSGVGLKAGIAEGLDRGGLAQQNGETI